MICIGHRGAAGHEPENTLRSFRAALAFGAPWVELDVQAVEDELVVFHDETLDRTTNGRGLLSEQGFEAIRRLDAGKGEKIPTLDEVFDLVSGNAGLNIELKGPRTAQLAAALIERRMKAGWDPDLLVVSSFNHRELAAFHSALPEVMIATLIYGIPLDNANLAEKIGASELHASLDFIDAELVDDAHRRNLKVKVYTVNTLDELRRMSRLGVDGVFSDYPDRILAAIAH
jgi:glycerophosphoryl diester phosphodiesterase